MLERREQREQRLAQQRARVGVGAGAAVARLEIVEQVRGGRDADVGGEQRGLELVERLVVERAAANAPASAPASRSRDAASPPVSRSVHERLGAASSVLRLNRSNIGGGESRQGTCKP